MGATTTTFDFQGALAARLRRYGPKYLARITGASVRTADGWLQQEAAPNGKHIIAMLQDDALFAELMDLIGRQHLVDLEASLRRIDELRALLGQVDRGGKGAA